MKTFVISLLLSLCPAVVALAEWRTETYTLKAGWNAIYPTVDASHTTLDTMLAAYPAILEVWRWQPERVDPRLPGNVAAVPVGVEWSTWKAGVPEETTFDRLSANYGYLVKLADNAPQQTLTVKGRATLPEVRWRGDGLHLAGFPVITTGTRPTFSTYLAPTAFALGNTEILRYNGGPIAANVNPVAAVPSVSRLERGQAYWIRVEKFSRYFGPLKIELGGGSAVGFGNRSDTERLVLTNETSANLTFTLSAAASEAAPAGQPAIAGTLPLLAEVDAETQFTPLGTRTITLAAKAVVQVRLLPDRTAMGGAVGSRFAALVKLETTAGLAGQQVFLPATAEVSSPAGLWIGEVEITQVGSIVRRYERDAAGNTVQDAAGNPRVLEDLSTPGGATELPTAARPYPLRLLVHVNAAGQARLLAHVYQGKLAAAPPETPLGLALQESSLDATALRQAVRLSVAHLPLDTVLPLNGSFVPGGALAGANPLFSAHNAADNPFLHVYHPDHDNRDARFQNALPAGRESFNISRQLTLTFDQSRPAESPATWGTTLLTGFYGETITGTTKADSALRVRGPFVLHKVSDIATLTGL